MPHDTGASFRNWRRENLAHRRVFISHASEDTDIAFNVAALIKRYLDLDPQVDQGFLRPGTDWSAEITRRVGKSELVIVLLSRVVAGELAKGVEDEIKLAQSLNIPIVFGRIRGYRSSMRHQVIDFGEDGRRVDGIWDLAKYLLSESHQFRVLGLDSLYVNPSATGAVLGSPEDIANQAAEISILGHTMKKWLGDYGNAIRHGKASISMYFPAVDAIGMDLLVATHRNGTQVLEQIARAKRHALAIEEELDDPAKFSCYAVRIKPMFSAMIVDRAQHNAFIVADHYSLARGAEGRPNLVIHGSSTPLFEYYSSAFDRVIADAYPLKQEIIP
ncbi:TIR domain-containing protein [Thermomonospora echinospora]|uniref:TIR domain-containing protein n=1 Tax=Thermomonospora echinospora TaxID=1992 RepID=A0A1H6DWE4_9ACTN|nr:toll/interleukin-1 receptor domain-containing protein [Thermomonospora echinospora]SEG89404.1 TIR domain-containing protein [Thermomonospora echinospora]